jgi:hypothetical protein
VCARSQVVLHFCADFRIGYHYEVDRTGGEYKRETKDGAWTCNGCVNSLRVCLLVLRLYTCWDTSSRDSLHEKGLCSEVLCGAVRILDFFVAFATRVTARVRERVNT